MYVSAEQLSDWYRVLAWILNALPKDDYANCENLKNIRKQIDDILGNP